jgi:hypothetical protein
VYMSGRTGGILFAFAEVESDLGPVLGRSIAHIWSRGDMTVLESWQFDSERLSVRAGVVIH